MSLVSLSDNFGQISLYQIINYSGSILHVTNLNNTNRTCIQIEKNIYKGLHFVVERFLAENVQNLQFLLFQQLENMFNISLFLEVLFLCARDI